MTTVVTTVVGACLVGSAGAGAIEVAELQAAMKKVKDFPWRVKGEARLSVYLFSVVLRLVLGAAAAWMCFQIGPLNFASAAAAGIAAPKVVEQVGQLAARVTSKAEAADQAASPADGALVPALQAVPTARSAAVTEGGSIEAASR